MLLLYALSLGFIGSFHCIGMCGPIALTLPVQHLQGVQKLGGMLLYNMGRVSAYALLGGLFGWLGRQLYLGGLQQWLSVTAGVAVLLVLLLKGSVQRLHLRGYLWQQYTTRISAMLGSLLRRRQLRTLYAIGFLNGLLPCGLVYLGIAGAVATGHTGQGALFMCAFGAGTLPAMMAVSSCSQLAGLRFRKLVRRLQPFAIGIMALLLIMRGLNLGIPYISPLLSPQNEKVTIHCHKP